MRYVGFCFKMSFKALPGRSNRTLISDSRRGYRTHFRLKQTTRLIRDTLTDL